MKARGWFTGGLWLMLLFSGCDGETGSGTTARPATAGIVTTAPSAASAAAVPYADVEVPDEADFAADAEREITAENYRDELTELERELGDAAPAASVSAASAPARAPSSARDRD